MSPSKKKDRIKLDVVEQQGDSNNGTEADSNVPDAKIGPLPRTVRRPRRPTSDRGLPPDEELAKLWQAYVEFQQRNWPQVFVMGLLPEPTDKVSREMVEDFKHRHRTAKVDVGSIRPYLAISPKLGGSYSRYSCDNSNPTSALDQMVNCLVEARSEDKFVPWAYIFADYSVTGLDSGRQGYSSYKAVLSDTSQLIETTYIDDFTRASRDALEWWKLAALSKRLNKRMIGASDGFDLSSPDWDIRITIYGLLSRLFIKGLREKVKRGMAGAARRGTCLGKLGLGFTRRPRCDEHGNVLLDSQGQPIYEPCIDPATRESRLLMYQMFVEQNLSAHKIVHEFNRLKIDGWNGWTPQAIKKLLWKPDAIGVFIWNKTRREYDDVEEKWVVKRNPHKEWVVRYAPECAIVPLDLFRAARRKLSCTRRASPLTGRKMSRNQASAKTLFSGTLFCEYCDAEIKLARSTTNYKQAACLNGLNGKHDCLLSTSKSTRVIEECLLDYIRETVLTDECLETLVASANKHVATEAQKPQVNTRPWKADLASLQKKIKKLVILIENDENQELCVAQNARVKELQREANALQVKIRKAEAESPKQIKPLSIEKARGYLDQLRVTLGADIPVAAEAIRSITGPIKIRQEVIKGRKSPRWVATFSPDLLGALRLLADGKQVGTFNHVHGDAPPLELVLEKTPQYELLAPIFKEMKENDVSIASIASMHRMSWAYADEILTFAETGERPKWASGISSAHHSRKSENSKYIRLAARVVKLREEKRMSFKKIAKKYKVSESTVSRAYDHARPEETRRAARNGKRVPRGTYSHLGEDVYREIRTLLRAGKKVSDIASKVGCSNATVYNERRKLKLEQGD